MYWLPDKTSSTKLFYFRFQWNRLTAPHLPKQSPTSPTSSGKRWLALISSCYFSPITSHLDCCQFDTCDRSKASKNEGKNLDSWLNHLYIKSGHVWLTCIARSICLPALVVGMAVCECWSLGCVLWLLCDFCWWSDCSCGMCAGGCGSVERCKWSSDLCACIRVWPWDLVSPLLCQLFFFFALNTPCTVAFSPLFPPPFDRWFYVSTQRKPEDESPVKDTDAKQAKQEATVNGSAGSSASNGNGVQEGKSQEASDRLMSLWNFPGRHSKEKIVLLWCLDGRERTVVTTCILCLVVPVLS